ncbi:hypothetical protein KEM54_000018 [Ascosphaera aggregata]|nr:hypothetical protein KEM54_000018 [Ascosphaera aggregata]
MSDEEDKIGHGVTAWLNKHLTPPKHIDLGTEEYLNREMASAGYPLIKVNADSQFVKAFLPLLAFTGPAATMDAVGKSLGIQAKSYSQAVERSIHTGTYGQGYPPPHALLSATHNFGASNHHLQREEGVFTMLRPGFSANTLRSRTRSQGINQLDRNQQSGQQNGAIMTAAGTPLGSLIGLQVLPQTVAHRGYKGQCPENSMLAFEMGVKAGANALECDMHLSKDGVVVVNHDNTIKRCHGVDRKVIDCDWDYLSTLKSIAEPHVAIPRLSDLLQWLAVPEREHIWVYVELKLHDDAGALVKGVSDVLASVPSTPSRPWNTRIMLGIWTANYLSHIERYLPTYTISLLTPSLTYASCFLSIPQITSFSVNFFLLYSPAGSKFLADAHAAGKAVYAWTVNKPRVMNAAIRSNLDGVVTDEVDMYVKIREEWERKFISREEQGAGREGGLFGFEGGKKDAGVDHLPIQYRLAIKFFVGITNALGSLVAWKHKSVLSRFQVMACDQQPAATVMTADAQGVEGGGEISHSKTVDSADSTTRLN